MINLHYKKCLPVIIRTIKHKSKQVIPVTYTLGKKVFATAIFQGLKFKYTDIRDLVDNISKNTIGETDAKIKLNALNELKNAEIRNMPQL